jgi:hypothetical protein
MRGRKSQALVYWDETQLHLWLSSFACWKFNKVSPQNDSDLCRPRLRKALRTRLTIARVFLVHASEGLNAQDPVKCIDARYITDEEVASLSIRVANLYHYHHEYGITAPGAFSPGEQEDRVSVSYRATIINYGLTPTDLKRPHLSSLLLSLSTSSSSVTSLPPSTARSRTVTKSSISGNQHTTSITTTDSRHGSTPLYTLSVAGHTQVSMPQLLRYSDDLFQEWTFLKATRHNSMFCEAF